MNAEVGALHDGQPGEPPPLSLNSDAGSVRHFSRPTPPLIVCRLILDGECAWRLWLWMVGGVIDRVCRKMNAKSRRDLKLDIHVLLQTFEHIRNTCKLQGPPRKKSCLWESLRRALRPVPRTNCQYDLGSAKYITVRQEPRQQNQEDWCVSSHVSPPGGHALTDRSSLSHRAAAAALRSFQ